MPATIRPDNAIYNRGALVAVFKNAGTGKVTSKTTIPFQYNPEQLTRTLTPDFQESENRLEQGYVKGATQSISLNVKLQAVDAMIENTKKGDLEAAGRGLYALLAALELLLFPSVEEIDAYRTKVSGKVTDADPPAAPDTLFVWGAQRVLPVQLTTFTVTETTFNIALSPIEAAVELAMKVENPVDSPKAPYDDYLRTYMQNMEKFRDRQGADFMISKQGAKAKYWKVTGARY